MKPQKIQQMCSMVYSCNSSISIILPYKEKTHKDALETFAFEKELFRDDIKAIT